jgi:hypothetical protein
MAGAVSAGCISNCRFLLAQVGGETPPTADFMDGVFISQRQFEMHPFLFYLKK